MSVGTTLLQTTSNMVSLVFDGALNIAALDIISYNIKDDMVNGRPTFPGAFSQVGLLYIPNRGVLKMFPGDVVGVDDLTGWPILVSKDAVANGNWQNVQPPGHPG